MGGYDVKNKLKFIATVSILNNTFDDLFGCMDRINANSKIRSFCN